MDIKKIMATSSMAMALAVSGTAIISPQAHASAPAMNRKSPSQLERNIATELSDTQTPRRDMQRPARPEHVQPVQVATLTRNSILPTDQILSLGDLFDEIASLLGLTSQELKQYLQDGDTIAQIAEHQGIEETKITDLLINNISTIWQQQLAAGQITQAQYEQYMTEAEDQAQTIINSSM